MRLPWSHSLRQRVWLPVAAVALPMFVYSAVIHWLARNNAIEEVQQRIGGLVRAALAEAADDESRELALLRSVAHSKELASLNADECNGLSRRLMETQKDFIDIGAASPDGLVFCSSDPRKLGVRVSDQEWFRHALGDRKFTGLDFVSGADHPAAVYGYPLLGSHDEIRAVAFAVAPAKWFDRVAKDERFQESWSILLLSGDGTVLSERGGHFGTAMPFFGNLAKLLGQMGQAAVSTGRASGRFYGIGHLPFKTQDLFLLADTPEADALHDIDANFELQLAMLLSVAVFAALLGHLDSKRIIVSWAERLQQTVRQLAAGEAEARIVHPSPLRELGDIDRAFNEMAEHLATASLTLREAERRWLMALEGAGHGVWDWDIESGQIFFSRQWNSLLGLPGGEVSGTMADWERRIHPDDLQDHRRSIEEHLNGESGTLRTEHRLLCEDGAYRRFLCLGMVVCRDAGGRAARAIGTHTETEWQRRAEDRLRLADQVFSKAGEAIIITDADNRIIRINEAFCAITGYSEADVLGKSPAILKSGLHGEDFYRELWMKIEAFGCWQGQVWNKRRSGEMYLEGLTISVVRDERGRVTNYLGIFSDISALEDSRQRLEYLATHDTLTTLPNRSLFADRLQHALLEARRDNDSLAVVFVDLDNFKVINDSLGHEFGDRVLTEAASRMAGCVRDVDSVARLGGDEFAIVLRRADGTQAGLISSRILNALAVPINVGGKNVFVTASIGISLFPVDGDDEGSLMRNADVAMYRAKERGKNQTQYFRSDMKELASRRLALETGLRLAVERRGFDVVYQPKLDIRSGAVVGAEALVRWRDPELGPVGPAEFIPVAEACGLINNLGRQVVDAVLADVSHWQSCGLCVPRIYVNVSPFQLRAGFAAWLGDRLGAAGLCATAIGVEVTEGALMEQSPKDVDLLDGLAREGVSISIDDFGTGYSSLAYLKRFPISELKIDRSFVCDIDRDPDDQAIARAVLNMAHALGLVVVAEGVETAEQLATLTRLGCDLAQGYLFHAPLAAAAFAELLDRSEATSKSEVEMNNSKGESSC